MTDQTIRRLARKGTPEAKAELKRQAVKEASKASRKMKKLKEYEKRVGKTRAHSFARDIFEASSESIGVDNIYIPSDDTETLAKQLAALTSFNESVTSTISGVKEQELELKRRLKEKGLKVPRGKNWERLVEIFSSDAMRDLEDFSSDRRFKTVIALVDAKVTMDKLESLWADYEKGTLIDNAWEQWTGINPFLL